MIPGDKLPCEKEAVEKFKGGETIPRYGLCDGSSWFEKNWKENLKYKKGESRGSEGKVLRIDRIKNRVVVEGVNIVKKHVKPSAANPQGGIEEKEAGVHISNLMVVVGGVASKIGRKKGENGKMVRILKKNGEVVK